jgi:hypothetical protein
LADGAAMPRVVLGRARGAGRLIVADNVLAVRASTRSTLQVPASNARSWLLKFETDDPMQPIVLEEVGLFPSEAGLMRPMHQPLQWLPAWGFYNTAVVLFVFAVAGFVIAAGFAAPGLMRRYGPWFLTALTLAVCVLEVATTFSPYWKYDLRSFYASDIVESGADGNLTGGLIVGARAYSGQGLTFPPGLVEWHRMPGYALFCAAAAALGRTTDLVQLAMIVIVLQMIVYAAAVGIFAAVARRFFGTGVATLLSVLLMFLPKQLHNTQSDSIVMPIAIVVAAALIACVSELRADGAVRLRTFALTNAAFALWFLMRSDVLPGWFIVAVVLAGWHLRYLLVPAVLALAIALAWGLYKRPYRHELNLLPTNGGEVAFLSLCDVPNTLPYPCTDDGYLTWIQRVVPGDPTSDRSSRTAVAEVVRYWVAYPIHVVLMVSAKLNHCLTEEFWSGVFTRFNKLFTFARDASLSVYLLALMLGALAVGYERRRVFLLGWAVFLNMPLYFVVWESNGRFYAPAGVALLTASVPLLFERALFRRFAQHPWLTAAVACGVAVVVYGSMPLDRWIVAHPGVHYWSPLADPHRSSLVAPR